MQSPDSECDSKKLSELNHGPQLTVLPTENKGDVDSVGHQRALDQDFMSEPEDHISSLTPLAQKSGQSMGRRSEIKDTPNFILENEY